MKSMCLQQVFQRICNKKQDSLVEDLGHRQARPGDTFPHWLWLLPSFVHFFLSHSMWQLTCILISRKLQCRLKLEFIKKQKNCRITGFWQEQELDKEQATGLPCGACLFYLLKIERNKGIEEGQCIEEEAQGPAYSYFYFFSRVSIVLILRCTSITHMWDSMAHQRAQQKTTRFKRKKT